MQIENCKYSSIDLANKFTELANKFLRLYESHKTLVDFEASVVIQNVFGIRASYVGFIGYVLEPTNSHMLTHKKCLNLTLEYLGFKKENDLLYWATKNPNIFNTEVFDFIFTELGYIAFDKEENEIVTLLDFVQKHIVIADNLKLIGTNNEYVTKSSR